jgi:hypothetical protein
MTLVDDLKAARALIADPDKWRKDDMIYQPGCCAIIAVQRVTTGRHGAASRAEDAIYSSLPERWRSAVGSEFHAIVVGHYNDDPATTHNDILALFDRAIDAATLSQQKDSLT